MTIFQASFISHYFALGVSASGICIMLSRIGRPLTMEEIHAHIRDQRQLSALWMRNQRKAIGKAS